jgi:hypothetical protein
MRRCILKSRAENMRRLRMPYSTPRLIPYSLSGLAAYIGKKSADDGRPVENRLSSIGTQPPPLIIEGFEGGVGDLVQILSSIGWRSQISPEPVTEIPEAIREKRWGAVENGICILLVDMRRRFSGSCQPLTRIGIDSDLSVTLVLILTDSGEDFMAGGEIRRTDRWYFRGPIGPNDLGVLIKSIFQIWAAPVETPAKPSSRTRMSRSSASAAVTFAERE